MNEHIERDDALFESMAAGRRRRRRKIIITVMAALLLIGAAGALGVSAMRRSVTKRFAQSGADVRSYTASVGTISTAISGSGMIFDVDTEDISVPTGIEIVEILVSAGDAVSEGDSIASVKLSSVLSAISDLQDEIDKLDSEISAAKNSNVSGYITTGVNGRVKRLIAEPDDTVIDCMTRHGALAYLSIDGCMALDIECSSLISGDSVTVTTDGRDYVGTVESVASGVARISLTDDGPCYDADAEVYGADGVLLGNGRLYIHNPIAITGYAGTIHYACAQLNSYLYAGNAVYVLSDTGTSAARDALVQTRRDKQDELYELMGILASGAVCAPSSGTVSSVDYSDDTPSASLFSTSVGTRLKLLTLSPGREVCVNIGVDESNILSLKVGQDADVTVSAVGDELINGRVTEIDKTAASTSGVTQYSATVTFPKSEKMLKGMTATADIRIEGIDNAVIIPTDALHQTSKSYYVYTGYDEETKEYIGLREVVPGVSNSNFVEIISGLSEGETVYYVPAVGNGFMAFMGGGMSGGMGGGMSGRPAGAVGRPGSAPGGNMR